MRYSGLFQASHDPLLPTSRFQLGFNITLLPLSAEALRASGSACKKIGGGVCVTGHLFDLCLASHACNDRQTDMTAERRKAQAVCTSFLFRSQVCGSSSSSTEVCRMKEMESIGGCLEEMH
jgi:hypothetical protein